LGGTKREKEGCRRDGGGGIYNWKKVRVTGGFSDGTEQKIIGKVRLFRKA